MKLTKIEIRSFRCFEHLTVSLEPDVTAIIGVNEAGKTALLDAIALGLLPLLEATGLQPKNQTMRGLIGDRDITGAAVSLKDIHRTSNDPELKAYGVTASALAPDRDHRQVDQELRWSMGVGPIALPQPANLKWLKPEGLEPAADGLRASGADGRRDLKFDIPVLAYYRDSRNCSAFQHAKTEWREPFHPDSAYYRAFDASADFDVAQRWFYTRENQELRAARDKSDPDFRFDDLVAIREALSLMLDAIGRIYADDDPPRMKVNKISGDGKTLTLELSQLSAGQRNLLALTLDFARRLAVANPGRDKPLEATGILLIDEIELNLHPKWQQTVIPKLRRVFPNIQIIVATHSPQVLSTLEARQIRVLRDQKVLTPSVETYGTDTGRVQRLVMDTETRPPDNPVTKRINKLYAEIADDHLDQAEKLLAELQTERDSDDPTLIEAQELIENRKWETEIGL
ncbi:MAG: AAA family ATPase [Chromatiaceae bacterium]|nr:AAA family ATPase [Chromatiaceae bacterium]